MDKKIQELYETISFLGFHATYSRDNGYVQNCQGLIPKIQEFVRWFFIYVPGLEEGVYCNLADILKDCETAFCENDHVLMMDALEQGIAGYLEMFLPDEYFKEKETAYVRAEKGTES
ncbi:MAG: hypothetical protein HFH39_08010 [Lachnospiraceae bacterium]|nr:hypothetical protein [Lachnospiraceae bacterium]